MSRMPGKTKLLASCLLAGLMTLTGCTVTTPYPVVKEPPSPVVNRPAVARKPVLALALGGGAARGACRGGGGHPAGEVGRGRLTRRWLDVATPLTRGVPVKHRDIT